MMVLNERDRQQRIDMLQSALDANPNSDSAPKVRALLVELQGTPGLTGPISDPDDGVDRFRGRNGGDAAANQFGTFQVHAASDRQVSFLKRLIAEKDTTGVTIPASVDGISKKSASALIDKLMGKPAKQGIPITGRLASEKQLAFVAKLVAERDWAGVVDGLEVDTDRSDWISSLTGTRASKVIDALLSAPRRRTTQPEVELAPGAYRLEDGRIVRVYLGQQSGKMLAAELVDITAEDRDDAWHYLGMASRFVKTTDHRLTVAEAEQLAANGLDHSWCCVCSRRLDDPNSVARSIGPICRAKQGG